MLPQATEQSDELGVSCNGFRVRQEYILYLIVMGSRTQVVNTALLGPMPPLCCVPQSTRSKFLVNNANKTSRSVSISKTWWRLCPDCETSY